MNGYIGMLILNPFYNEEEFEGITLFMKKSTCNPRSLLAGSRIQNFKVVVFDHVKIVEIDEISKSTDSRSLDMPRQSEATKARRFGVTQSTVSHLKLKYQKKTEYLFSDIFEQKTLLEKLCTGYIGGIFQKFKQHVIYSFHPRVQHKSEFCLGNFSRYIQFCFGIFRGNLHSAPVDPIFYLGNFSRRTSTLPW